MVKKGDVMTKHPPEGPESTVTENNDRLNGGVDLLAKAMRRVFREEVADDPPATSPRVQDAVALLQRPKKAEQEDG